MIVKSRAFRMACATGLALWSAAAWASGPRWVTGPPYFTTYGQAVGWYTSEPLYFTDPGDLSASVDHAAADTLVAAAASVWNVPTSSLTLARGGALAEHVSSANVYMGPNGPVLPADVSSSNYAAVQIPVIYDTDGSITDLLLGQGASDPSECQQNGVTESVDAITPAGNIDHALLILNGRCSGPLPEQQLQLQYQLMRAFGRVLGLGWSQVNDNVFTGNPEPTPGDIANWPIMHPIDIVCGTYTYQCLTSPFSLRIDDIASISALYFIAKGTAAQGKSDTLSNASQIHGAMEFGGGGMPGGGAVDTQGMQGMNLIVRRRNPGSAFTEESAVLSAVTGVTYRWSNGNPVTGPQQATVAQSMGTVNASFEGRFNLGPIPLLPGLGLQDAFITSEPINPLYTGEYGIGPYAAETVTPSGPAFPWNDNGIVPYSSNNYLWSVPGSVAECAASGLGTQTAPLPFDPSGWWTDVLCGYGASAWQTLRVQANRSVTVEVTALDEEGLVTENKLLPLTGVWQQSDPVATLPTVAAAVSPFNSIAAGLTLMNFDTPQTGALRLVITDERGDGRPDFGFRARVLYADAISPSTIAAGGGLVLVTGMGFRPGNQVTIGGTAATILSTTTDTILAVAPPFAAVAGSVASGSGFTVDVGVVDAMTGGSTFIYGGLTYPASAAPSQSPALTVLTPAFYLAAGAQAELMPLASLSEGGAAAAAMEVTWSDVSGPLTFANRGQSTSDSNGLATLATTAGPLRAGANATGSACAFGHVCGSFAVTGVDPSQWVLTALAGQQQSVASGAILQPVVMQVSDGAGHPVIGAAVAVYQTVSGYEVCPAQGRCPIPEVYATVQAAAVSDVNGLIVVTPQQLTGTPEVTTIAGAAGSQGFVSVRLKKHP